MNKLLPYVSLLIVLCCAPSLLGQNSKPGVMTRIEEAFDEQRSEWEIVRKFVSKDLVRGSPKDTYFTRYQVTIELKAADDFAVVSITYWDNTKSAQDVFKGIAIAADTPQSPAL